MRHFHFAFIASLLLILSEPARADLPPPDTLDCRTAKEGDACSPDGQPSDAGKPGTCRKATCTRLDYANWNRDASAAPPTMQYECLKCLLGSADGGLDGSTASGGAGGSAGTGGSGTGGAAPKSGSSGCAMGGRGRALAPWLLAGGFAAAVWFGRRRR
jgi:hypothetical protein